MGKIKKALLVLIAAVIFLIVASAVTISVNFVFDMLPIEVSVIALVVICIVVGYIFVSDWFDKPETTIKPKKQEEAVETVDETAEDETPTAIDDEYWDYFFEYWRGLEGKEFENWLRDTINKDILKGETLNRALRYKNTDILNAVERMIDHIISDEVFNNSQFVDEFVELKNRMLGNFSVWFSSSNSILSVTFSNGDRYGTNRQVIECGKEYTMPVERVCFDVYTELEHFLLGIYSFDKFRDKVYKNVDKFIKDMVCMNFQSIIASVNPSYCYFGNDEVSVEDLCDMIKAANLCDNLIIAGTRGALRRLGAFTPDKTLEESDDEVKTSSRGIGKWNDYKLMPISHTIKSSELNFDMDNKLFILPCNKGYKPIKLDLIGDTRIKMSDISNNDIDIMQASMAAGLLVPENYGIYTFSN